MLVVGGSRRYTNTPAIVSLGSLRVGTDLVSVASPGRSADLSAARALNIVSQPLDGNHLRADHVPTIRRMADDADCLAIGPGLGTGESVSEAVREILDGFEGRSVVDADALHATADRPALLEGSVITPHSQEFEMLSRTVLEPTAEPERETVRRLADELECTVLLKGSDDRISDGDSVKLNTTGNRFMTRGGTGDILTGLVAGLIAQGAEPFQAAVKAAELNGRAGERAAEACGEGFLLEEMLAAVSELVGGGAR